MPSPLQPYGDAALSGNRVLVAINVLKDPDSPLRMPHYFSQKGYDGYVAKFRELEKRFREQEHLVGEAHESGGDIAENNAPFEVARHESMLIQERLRSMRTPLNDPVIVEYPSKAQKVCLGCVVTVKRNDTRETYGIVGHGDDDPDRDWILYSSPLAQLLLGHKKGEQLEGIIGGEKRTYEIVRVRPLLKARTQ